MAVIENRISEKGKALLEALVDALTEHGHGEHDYDKAEVPDGWEDYPLLWSGWGLDREGCCREGGVFGDMSELEGEIREMFGYYFRTIRDFVLQEIGSSAFFDLVVEPSYEDHTCYVMSNDDTIIIKGSCKAWNFGADSPEELAEMMEDDYQTIRNNITAALIKESTSEPKDGEVKGNEISFVSTYFESIIVKVGSGDDKYETYRLDLNSLLRLLQQQKFTVEKKRVHKYLHIV